MLWLLKIQNSLRRQEGQDLTEYALLLGLIVLLAVAAVRLMGTSIKSILDRIAAELAGV